MALLLNAVDLVTLLKKSLMESLIFCAALVSNEMPSIFANKCPVLVSI